MASKNNNLPDKPIVSRVPLPISDSALVIDLPDGQKLVIGKMGQGTVIEVATWRGVIYEGPGPGLSLVDNMAMGLYNLRSV